MRRFASSLLAADVPDAEDVARAEIVDDVPAMAGMALRRQLAGVMHDGRSHAEDVRRIVHLLASGSDPSLDVEWHLVDGRGRPVAPLTPEDVNPAG